SLSHISNVGLPGFVARDFDEYVAVALQWARDLPRLAAVRAELRVRMALSPLCDGRRFARHLEHALRVVWQRWCESPRRGKPVTGRVEVAPEPVPVERLRPETAEGFFQ